MAQNVEYLFLQTMADSQFGEPLIFAIDGKRLGSKTNRASIPKVDELPKLKDNSHQIGEEGCELAGVSAGTYVFKRPKP